MVNSVSNDPFYGQFHDEVDSDSEDFNLEEGPLQNWHDTSLSLCTRISHFCHAAWIDHSLRTGMTDRICLSGNYYCPITSKIYVIV